MVLVCCLMKNVTKLQGRLLKQPEKQILLTVLTGRQGIQQMDANSIEGADPNWDYTTPQGRHNVNVTKQAILQGIRKAGQRIWKYTYNFSICTENINSTGLFLGNIPKFSCNQILLFNFKHNTFCFEYADNTKPFFCKMTEAHSYPWENILNTWLAKLVIIVKCNNDVPCG